MLPSVATTEGRVLVVLESGEVEVGLSVFIPVVILSGTYRDGYSPIRITGWAFNRWLSRGDWHSAASLVIVLYGLRSRRPDLDLAAAAALVIVLNRLRSRRSDFDLAAAAWLLLRSVTFVITALI
jgi:hypothetical protein